MNGRRSENKNENAPLQIALTKTYKTFKSVDPTQQFRETCVSLARYLSRLCSYFELYPECTDDGNLHYHAYLVIKDEYKWFRHGQRALRRSGFIKCKAIRGLRGWRKYCSKKSKTYTIKLFDLAGLYPITRENYKTLEKRQKSTLPLQDKVTNIIDQLGM